MSDVARLAGVSIKTVSRVVNEEPGVHAQTASQVRAAIEELGFRRHLGARSLRQGTTTSTIGLLLEDVSNPFYSALTRGVEEVARRFDRRVLTASSDEDPEQARKLVLEFCARRVDGLLLVPAGREHGYLAGELHAGTPMVAIDRPTGNPSMDTVTVDNRGGTMAAVAHLAGYGHRRIGFLGDNAGIYTAQERLRGFRTGCASAGISGEHVAMGPYAPDGVRAAMRVMLRNSVTALIGGNNRITIALLRAMASEPVRPALVGFDDFELADMLDPPVTVIAHDVKALGEAAANRLFARVHGDDSPAREIVLPTEVVPRGSGEQAVCM